MHGKTGKRLDIGVPMVQRVNVFIHGLNVDEPMSKIEVKLPGNGVN